MRRLLACLLLAAIATTTRAADLLVGNKSDDTVWRLSLADGKCKAQWRSGAGPHEIAVSRSGRFALVTEYGREQAGSSIGVIDLHDGKTVARIALGDHGRPHGVRILLGDARAVVTTEASGSLLLVDIAARKIERAIDVGRGMGHMVALSRDGKVAYVSKIQAGSVVRVPLDGGASLERPANEGAEGIEVAPDGTVWVANREAGTVTVHDPVTLAIVATLASPGFPIRVAFTADGLHALVSNAKAGTLRAFDAVTRKPVATVDVVPPGIAPRKTMLGQAALPIGIAVHPDEPRAYVAVAGSDRIAVVDTRTWKVVGHWATGREPDALGVVPRRD